MTHADNAVQGFARDPRQMSIAFEQRVRTARRLGTEASERGADRAERCAPDFRRHALDFLVAYVRQQGTASGESITHAAVLAGIRPPDLRHFGAVFQQALREDLVRIVGAVPRVHGHGSAGGKVYALGEGAQ